MDVVITVKQGPVIIQDHSGWAVKQQYDLWDGIKGEEEFPATKKSAFYWLRLRKNVTSHDEVDGIEKCLIDALRCLSRVWQFAGGTLMSMETTRVERVPSFESNASEVKEHLLAKEGKKQLISNIKMFGEVCGTYRRFPLKPAIELCLKCKEDLDLLMLFEYYCMACTDISTWFIDLYKVRDVLSRILVKKKIKRKNLNIDLEEWCSFGKKLNAEYDLRHPPRDKAVGKKISREEVQELRKLGSKWITAYLNHIGIEV